MKAADLMAKATRAVDSSRLLLENGDLDGACNRADYAMFDAARAALLAAAIPSASDIPRSHSGLISAFSLHLVKPGRIPIALGRALNRAEEIRLIADYKGESVDHEHAAWAVTQADEFVAAMRQAFPDLGAGVG
ncbi:MAG: HEPN domain-containing protein [Chromatiaceae bacterium]|nr:HEPN domain-containing protein [Chromatiaceae bacterium]